MMIIVNGLITGMLDRTITNSVELETGHIKVYPQGYHEKADLLPTTMSISSYTYVIDLVQDVKGVTTAVPRIRAGGMLQNKETTRVIINGIDPEQDSKVRDLRKHIVKGEYLANDENIVIGEPLASRLNIKLHDEVVLSSVAADGAPVSTLFTVNALFCTGFSSYDGTMVFLPLQHAQKLLTTDGVTEIVVIVDNPEDVKTVTADIRETLHNNELPLEVLHWEQLSPELAQFAEMEKKYVFPLFVYRDHCGSDWHIEYHVDGCLRASERGGGYGCLRV